MKYIIIALSFVTAVSFTACGKKGGGDSGGGAVARVPGTTGVVPTAQCTAGMVQTSFGCLERLHCPIGSGWYPPENRCVSGTIVNYNQVNGQNPGLRWGFSLQHINRDQFEALMRDFGGFCDQYTWNFGTAKCDNYSNAGFVIIEVNNADATEAQITIGAGASSPTSYYDPYLGGSQYYPMHVRAMVYKINANTGIEFRGTGIAGTRSWNAQFDQGIVVVSESSLLTANKFKADLYYRGVKFADAPVERY